MPETYVVHLGNSKELIEVSENKVAKRILCEHVRESLGVRSEDLAFALINQTHTCNDSLAWGECFGRITIEAMTFKLPVLGTAAGGTTEIVVNGTTGLLHPAGKEGVMPLAKNIVKLATNVEKRLTMGKEGYERVKERENLRAAKKEFNKTEDDLKSLQSVGQEKIDCNYKIGCLYDFPVIVKASSGPRYVVGCRSKVDKEKLTSGTRVVLDMTTLTIKRALPREVKTVVYNMLHEDPGNVSYSAVDGLSDQIRELRESIELALMNPELFLRVGIKHPKGALLYGPPGTGKTLLARAIASNNDANFLKVVSSAIIDKYIGESARLIREMFGYARDHQPCIIFMDEIDAIGGRRFSEGTSADREIQRTLMELLNQLDGFDSLGKVKMIMASNRPDVLDPALHRPGWLDRKIEIPLPNEQSRMEILKIQAAGIAKHGEIDYEAVVKLAEGYNGADLRNVWTEAGMSVIRAERDYVIHEDFMKR
ncbi:26S protease regulatory subunit 10B [Hibiscus syriacus]|uniref:26S protease regulatory subunit 10B n=1 Tax=Hibiscus syriacus TaxID=106335 RepID=A0A6A2WEC6_HIBSY|nr:26S protease regulatory subunit 10B [Hibiscus syriacus]